MFADKTVPFVFRKPHMPSEHPIQEAPHGPILDALSSRRGEWSAARTLAEQTRIPLSELAVAVEQAQRGGYPVEYHPRFGYRLPEGGGRLPVWRIRRFLGTSVIGCDVLGFGRVASTNDLAWAKAAEGAREGTVVFAEEQTAGRGRMGRRWWCPKGKGLLLSVVLRPRLVDSKQPMLTTMAAVALAQALREDCALPALIRWPNDILVRDRKAGGILVEARQICGEAAFVLGMGLNVSTRPDEFPPEIRETATSLSAAAGREVDRVECARAVLARLDRWYGAVRRGEYGPIAREWRAMSSTLGRRVTLSDSQQECSGRVLDLSLDDGLILRLDSGVTKVFPPGRFTLVREGGVRIPHADPPASAPSG